MPTRRPLLAALAAAVLSAAAPPAPAAGPDAVRVMTFNLWHGGDAGGHGVDAVVAAIRAARADVAGLQETAGYAAEPGGERPDRSAEIARRLGWGHVDQGGRDAVIGRFPVAGTSPGKRGVAWELPSGRRLWVFNSHLNHTPYQPYQLLGIPYGDAPFLTTADEAVAAARAARGDEVDRLLAGAAAARGPGAAVVVTGDFNEPSHRDWTPAAARAGLCPRAVRWPSTAAVEAAGFADALRLARPDPVRDRALTWTPRSPVGTPGERHDRIDFVFAPTARPGEPAVTVVSAEIVGEAAETADIVVAPFPSDHRAVVVELRIADPPAAR